MTYAVKAFDPTTGAATVEICGTLVSVDIPIVAGAFITGQDLDSYLRGFVPHGYEERQLALASMPAIPSELNIVPEVRSPDIECYSRLRARHYPPIEMYLDAVVKGDTEQQARYIELCLEVKAKFPKPEQVSDEVLRARRGL